MRGKRLPHFAAFSKSVAAEARAANVSRVSMDDTVNVFMVGLSGNVVRCSCLSELVRRVSECVCGDDQRLDRTARAFWHMGLSRNKELIIILAAISRLLTNHVDIRCLCEVTKPRQSILQTLKEIDMA